MLFVLLVAIGLGVTMHLPSNPNPRAWRDRLVSLHVLAIGFLIPLGTALLYLVYAAPVLDPARKRERTGLAIASGCLFSTTAVASLLFWVIIMAIIQFTLDT